MLIAVLKTIGSIRMVKWETDSENLWLRLMITQEKKTQYLNICAVYLPPPVQLQTLDRFLDTVASVIESTGSRTLIAGDFNLGFIKWELDNSDPQSASMSANNYNNSLGYSFVDFLSLNNLKQINHVKNHQGKSLDLILSNFNNILVHESNRPLSTIDPYHPPLCIEVFSVSPKYLKCKLSSKFNFRKANYQIINDRLNQINWTENFACCQDVNAMVEEFYKILDDITSSFVPKSKAKCNRYPMWFSKDLIHILNEKEKHRIRYKKYKNPRDEYEYKLLSQRANQVIKNCYKNFSEKMERGITHNPKLFWSFVKAKKSSSSEIPSELKLGTEVAKSGDDICNLFARHFSSTFSQTAVSHSVHRSNDKQTSSCNTLGRVAFSEEEIVRALKRLNVCKGAGPDGLPPLFVRQCAASLSPPLKIIFNHSIETSVFPEKWKLAHVVPIYKKGEADDVGNYRPISILSVFSKVFESLLCPILTAHFKVDLAPQQHGFCAKKSTTTNLLHYVNDLSKLVDSRKQVDSIYTDFSSAFDKVDHKILLHKLSNIGIIGQLWSWFKSYLTNRKQRVVVKGHQSLPYSSVSGVPQGSHLGPVLFIIFVNDIVDSIKHSTCSIFADDLKLYRVIDASTDAVLLQEDLDSVRDWCTRNRMILNADKCYHITFTKKRKAYTSSYSLDGRVLQKVDKIRDLGVILDSRLTFIPHIDSIVSRASKTLGFIKRICYDFKTVQTLTVLYNSFVRTVLEYASPVWNPTYGTHVDRLERIQKSFTRYLRYKSGNCPLNADYAQRLDYFRMSTLKQRRESNDLILLHKIINGSIQVPKLLIEIHISVPRHSLPRSKRNLEVFCLCPTRTNLGRFAPMNRLMRTYNELHKICSNGVDIFATSLSQFRKLLSLAHSGHS